MSKRIDRQVVLNDPDGQIRVALDQRLQGVLQLRFDQSTHQQELLLEILQLGIEISVHDSLPVRVARTDRLSCLPSAYRSDVRLR
jgi:hypothetical protein